ncbi:MAG: glycosyltransferase [Candidatus Microsaccharimonas sossegonensis]|uniref:Glycosyltransferase n=1 Tax=Candidatus Microsaccharimonas sossegonensis TaxID=2506948 RepID=A0A4V1J7H6_9BACT|nr:MAG: glycosyltransferase [Candidatus Microsaccharimonas sossegonensis]
MLQVILLILYAVLLGMFGLAAWRLHYAYRHFTMKSLLTNVRSQGELPSVTICIPARNETHAMTDALQRVIESKYPKLEVIVLDDLSGDDTSTIIKSFAHEGIRFVEGSRLPAQWLGKNHALQGLLQQASGSYVLFMDVDTRLSPDSIEQLVAYTQQEDALMVSVLPRREDSPRASVFFSPLRYFWEIMFHRIASPATASGAWMIHRQTLLDRWQGFTQFKDAIQPESRLSAELMAAGRYRFLIGTKMLGISYEKKWRSQVETSIRLLFPLLGSKRPNAIIAAIDLLIIASPVFIMASFIFIGFNIHQLISILFYLLFAGLYALYLRQMWNKAWLIGGLLWPYIIIQEAVLVVLSAIKYQQHTVTWKGRLVKEPK